MAEWLGSALQKLLQRFESASDLIVKRESPVVTATSGLLLLRVPTRVPTDGVNPSFGIPDATNRPAVLRKAIVAKDFLLGGVQASHPCIGASRR